MKTLEERFEPTGWLLLSNKPWACFSQFKSKGSPIEDSCCEKKRYIKACCRARKNNIPGRNKMKTKNVTEKNMKVCLVGSSGGHLTHLYMLKPFWKDKNRFWVTFDKEDARSLLEGEKVYPCYFPTNRSIKALIKNTKIAWDVLHKEKPDLIISCGAAVAVPFFYIGKMMGAKLVYIEVFDRIDKPTITGKMIYPIADKFVVQWEEQKKVYPKAVNLGSIF